MAIPCWVFRLHDAAKACADSEIRHWCFAFASVRSNWQFLVAFSAHDPHRRRTPSNPWKEIRNYFCATTKRVKVAKASRVNWQLTELRRRPSFWPNRRQKLGQKSTKWRFVAQNVSLTAAKIAAFVVSLNIEASLSNPPIRAMQAAL